MKKLIQNVLIAGACILSFTMAGCSQPNNAETAAPTTTTQAAVEEPSGSEKEKQTSAIFTLENYPRVDGSTATIPLSEQFAADAMGINLTEAISHIKHNTTHNAYVNLVDKNADIIFVTSPSEEELQLAKDAGIEYEIYPVVNEAFVFLVNEDNKVSDLSSSQIVDIYSGKITKWSEVGGADREIIPYQRGTNSGSQTGMLDLVMKDTPIMDAPTTLISSGMEGLVESIASYDNSEIALGYSYYYYVSNMVVRPKIKLLSIDGVFPEPDTIQKHQYPYATAYYAVIRKDEPADSPARQLLLWTLSPAGQAAAKEAGYVPVNE